MLECAVGRAPVRDFWDLDERGRSIEGSRSVNNRYWLELAKPGSKLPHPDKLYFGDLPPIVKRIESSSTPRPTTQAEPASRDE